MENAKPYFMMHNTQNEKIKRLLKSFDNNKKNLEEDC